MTLTVTPIGQSPFNPVRDFRALLVGEERVTLKDTAIAVATFPIKAAALLGFFYFIGGGWMLLPLSTIGGLQ